MLTRLIQRIAAPLERMLEARLEALERRLEARLEHAFEKNARSSAGKTLAKKRWDENGHKHIDLVEFNRSRRGF